MMAGQKIKTHTVSKSLLPFFENLPQLFKKEGVTIKNARNEIKIIKHREIPICVKSFNKITIFNRLMYSWFRPSKAERSFRTANQLLNRGLNTPEPLGFVEVKNKWGILTNCFYLSFFQHHNFTLAEVIKLQDQQNKKILGDFARFMAVKVHPNGIWHNDLSAGNILITEIQDKNYSFSIIDLNRISIRKQIPPRKGIRNLQKLTNSPIPLAIMAEEYALATKGDPIRYTFSLIGSHLTFSALRRTAKKLLLPFKHKKEKLA